VNNSTRNTGEQGSLFYLNLHSFQYVSKSGKIRSYGSSIFNFLKNLYSYFCSVFTNLYSQ
jgi:hypothetical protein